jgi:hypothetical protein
MSDLLSNAPIARRFDPSTSHEAAEHITKNGSRARQQNAVLDLVKRFPGHTSAELAAKSDLEDGGLDRATVARRLPELRKAHLVKNGWDRACTVTHHKGMSWYPV